MFKTVFCLLFVVLLCHFPLTTSAEFVFNEEVKKEIEERKAREQQEFVYYKSVTFTEPNFQTDFRIPIVFEISEMQNSHYMYCFKYNDGKEAYDVFYQAYDLYDTISSTNLYSYSRTELDNTDWYSLLQIWGSNVLQSGDYTTTIFGEKLYYVENAAHRTTIGMQYYNVFVFTTIHNGIVHSFHLESGASENALLRFYYILENCGYHNNNHNQNYVNIPKSSVSEISFWNRTETKIAIIIFICLLAVLAGFVTNAIFNAIQRREPKSKKKRFFHSYSVMWRTLPGNDYVTRADFWKAKILNFILYETIVLIAFYILWCFQNTTKTFWEHLWGLKWKHIEDETGYIITLVYLSVLLISYLITSKLYTARRLKNINMSPWLAIAPLSFFVCAMPNVQQSTESETIRIYTFKNAMFTFILTLFPFVHLYLSIYRKANDETRKT